MIDRGRLDGYLVRMSSTPQQVVEHPFRTLIIPDIHNRTDVVDAIMKQDACDEAVFLGDYFDSFGGTVDDALRTARWLKARLWLPGWHFLMGNHEAQYRWPKSPWHITNAYSADKQDAIDSVLNDADWRRMLFAVQRENWWMTHAGMHPGLFVHPVLGFEPGRTWEIFHRAEFEAHAGIHTPITDEQRANGGFPSGPLWLRWRNFVPVEGVNQVVGHTFQEEPARVDGVESENWNLDTNSQFYAILAGGRLTTHKIELV